MWRIITSYLRKTKRHNAWRHFLFCILGIGGYQHHAECLSYQRTKYIKRKGFSHLRVANKTARNFSKALKSFDATIKPGQVFWLAGYNHKELILEKANPLVSPVVVSQIQCAKLQQGVKLSPQFMAQRVEKEKFVKAFKQEWDNGPLAKQ